MKRMTKRRSSYTCWILAALALFGAGCRGASEYPDRPITLICPWAAGGGTDRVSRHLAVFLEGELGMPVNVVNATGGAGVTGHSRGLHARPDGYTITMMTVELNMLHWRKLTRISWRDAIPLVSINEDAAALFVRTDAPWKTLPDLAAAIRRRPGELRASGTAAGGIWHLAVAGWLQAAGADAVDVKWIPMNGANPSLQELASGGLDMVCCSLPEARTLYRAGLVRCLGVMAAERVRGFDDTPTFREQGADWTMTGWRGLGVPLATPAPIVERLSSALRRIVTGESQVQDRSFPEILAAEGFNNAFRFSEDFQGLLTELDAKFGTLLTSKAFTAVANDRVRPMTFPILLFVVFAGLLTALAFRRFWTRPAVPDSAADGCRPNAGGWWRFALVIACVAAYVGFAETIGFVLAAAGIYLVLAWALGANGRSSAVTAAVLAPAIYQVFFHALRTPLPRGWLGW
jgi:tripartite-type tricarboxylate transporter receptor subunit TctC